MCACVCTREAACARACRRVCARACVGVGELAPSPSLQISPSAYISNSLTPQMLARPHDTALATALLKEDRQRKKSIDESKVRVQ